MIELAVILIFAGFVKHLSPWLTTQCNQRGAAS